MKSHLFTVLRLAVVMGMFSGASAQAQDWPGFLETKQLFRVIVKGLGADGTALQPVKGTAWAVAPGVLITADHVTGKALNYKNMSSSDKVFIPRRDVTVEVSATKQFQGVDPQKYPGGIVTTSPFESIDAARIGFPDLNAKPFDLSACDIIEENTYRVLKFNAGNVFQPKQVNISLKAYGRSNLGDAGSVVVMTGAKGTIKEGDSGSPVFGPDDRVIGLVSAINADSGSDVQDEVHVTLVKSFLDLIPLQIGDQFFLDVPCSERYFLNKVSTLEGNLETANDAIATLKREKDTLVERFTGLERRNNLLTEQVNTLMRNQIKLANEAERGGNGGVNMPDIGGMELLEANNKLHDFGKTLFDNPINREPLRPTVTRISSELGSPDWTLAGSVSATNDVAISFSYERALSGPPYAQQLVFCFTPIAWDVPIGTPNDRDPSNRKFYVPIEGPFEPGQDPLDGLFAGDSTAPESCYPVDHSGQNTQNPDSSSVTKGSYQWTRRRGGLLDLARDAKRKYPNNDWDGSLYFQVFELKNSQEDGTIKYHVHTRALIDVLRDPDNANEGSAMPCKIFKDGPSLIEAVADSEEELPRENVCAQDT